MYLKEIEYKMGILENLKKISDDSLVQRGKREATPL